MLEDVGEDMLQDVGEDMLQDVGEDMLQDVGVADGCVVTGVADGIPEPVAVAADAELAASIMARHSRPSLIVSEAWEAYSFAGLQIRIKESTDLYGAVLWPSAMVLCHFLETNADQYNLVDKNVMELGAGTGLVTIVSSLLGAKVTSTDLPEVLGNLGYNVQRNTRNRCKYTPLVTELSWGQQLEEHFPRSTHHYDYVLAADVVYHHPFLQELLDTLEHLCQQGTQILWAMRFRMDAENRFVERFQQRFSLELLYDLPSLNIKLYRGWKPYVVYNIHLLFIQERDDEGGEDEDEREGRSSRLSEQETDVEEECCEIERMKLSGRVGDSEVSTGEQEVRRDKKPAWAPNFLSRNGRDVYHYAGQDIIIYESIDSYGSVMWPAVSYTDITGTGGLQNFRLPPHPLVVLQALALCSYLESHRLETELLGKRVLELGAGTGLVAIVSCLLGAAVTATDLQDVLGNLTANVMRNTRGRCHYMPQVAALSWGQDLERSFPRSLYHYDYVLAADVVYHHDFLEQLLLTMQHFCQPGTTLLWANKVRFSTDLTFTHKFQNSFHTQLLLEEGDMKIYKATSRDEGDMDRYSE
ncbi:putative methyltransferase-like protein [Merluccius polli]|uniref:Methyltransferase-like protein n=1 Tax=Merluccius polli TaxID=89951 RepID=A0AA47N152_MERPO|nr:putative methyltransferase-like protein [Merluccius polli]